MKKIKQAGIYTIALAFALSILPVTSYAQSSTEARCTVAIEKITARVAAVTKLQTERTAKYEVIKTQVDAFISKATAAQYPNVAELTTAREAVKLKVDDYAAQGEVYKKALETIQATPCGDASGDFIGAILAARTELVTLREDNLAVKQSIKQEAVPALRNYAAWLKTNSTEVKENE
ncbi:MAG: hypothetical protein WAQ27_06600 [Candidatus Microsaccharimonas sp.]